MTKLVFAHTVEGLFKRVIAPRASSQLKAELAAMGVTAAKDLEHETWVRVLAVTTAWFVRTL